MVPFPLPVHCSHTPIHFADVLRGHSRPRGPCTCSSGGFAGRCSRPRSSSSCRRSCGGYAGRCSRPRSSCRRSCGGYAGRCSCPRSSCRCSCSGCARTCCGPASLSPSAASASPSPHRLTQLSRLPGCQPTSKPHARRHAAAMTAPARLLAVTVSGAVLSAQSASPTTSPPRLQCLLCLAGIR